MNLIAEKLQKTMRETLELIASKAVYKKVNNKNNSLPKKLSLLQIDLIF
ncbi:MAG: hypothetical protein ACTMUB_02765 [cyanobacterium endosymbiont of Rhopalodia musculus]|nr:hypothetical protein [cyanobacterium endosymbiont of Epithemia clementina EcSB]WGT67146.1 hypothetical protein P3F56_07935 [cyanobacterium endosymbiont of Epithemia clementina EcSB]